MEIKFLRLRNFRGFQHRDFHFNSSFNVIVGSNAAGKSSLIAGLEVALNGWYQGLRLWPADRRDINSRDIRLQGYIKGRTYTLEPQYPVVVTAKGIVRDESMRWERSLHDPTSGKKTTGELSERFMSPIVAAVRRGADFPLPLIASYSVSRLWAANKEDKKYAEELSRFAGYKEWANAKFIASRVNELVFIEEQKAYRLDLPVDEGGKLLKQAILSCLENGKRIIYDVDLREIIVEFEDGRAVPYSTLSDGQRSILTLVADIARRMMALNPQLGDDVLAQTTGVVLIDELDIHLHPEWQRRVVADLRRVFPRVQFIVTTHSPQLLGEVKPEEIILLDRPELPHPAQSFGMDSNWILRHVMGSVDRDREVNAVLKDIFHLIEEDRFVEAKEKIRIAGRLLEGDHPDLAEASALIERYTRIGK